MKKILNNVLLLGGFYFVCSFLLDYAEFDYLNVLLFVLFTVLIVLTLFSIKGAIYTKLFSKHPYLCNYLMSLGVVQYISSLVFLIVSIDGYYSAEAEHNGYEYDSFFINYEQDINLYFFILIILSLLFATYKSFFKTKGR